jgi:hypothetical protein
MFIFVMIDSNPHAYLHRNNGLDGIGLLDKAIGSKRTKPEARQG